MEKIFIKPGEMHCRPDGTLIQTVLGSCISICVYDKRLCFGGMNHFVLPHARSEEDEKQNPGKYGSSAIHLLLKKMKAHGSKKEDLVIKILGGASSIGRKEHAKGNVGTSNVKIARDILKEFGLKISGESVGGRDGRKVEFDTKTGQIRFKMTIPQIEDLNADPNKIKVLIVDDSKPVRMFLRKMIEEDKNLEVVGEAEDPFKAMEIRKKIKVDVITLDINMPNMDGVTYLKKYMPVDPVPTIIVTDYNSGTSGPVFEALGSGAFDYMRKPYFDQIKSEGISFREKIIAAYDSNKPRTERAKKSGYDFSKISLNPIIAKSSFLAVGASTGGTEAIKRVFAKLPRDIPPTVIVQHIPKEFSGVFAQSLNNLCSFDVKEAVDGDVLKPSLALVAPGGMQMKVVRDGALFKVKLTDDPPVNRFKPSVDYLFNSLTCVKDKKMVAVLMTGMGSDGAEGLLKLQKHGAETIAQNEASCVVYGMPKAAVLLGAADHILHIDDIAGGICRGLRARKRKKIA